MRLPYLMCCLFVGIVAAVEMIKSSSMDSDDIGLA